MRSPAHCTSCYAFVGADAYIGPPHCTPRNVSLRSQCAHWLWQSASPVPLAPLPKGGWHGEAVTGGFFSRTPCNPSVGAGFYPARGRGRAPPLRTTRYAFVGAGVLDGPNRFFPALHGRAHGPCPTRRCVIGPGRTGSSAPTSAFVGADAYIGPPYRAPCKKPYHCLGAVQNKTHIIAH